MPKAIQRAATGFRRWLSNTRYRYGLRVDRARVWLSIQRIEVPHRIRTLVGVATGRSHVPTVRLSIYVHENGHRRSWPGLVAVGYLTGVGAKALAATVTGRPVGPLSTVIYRGSEAVPARAPMLPTVELLDGARKVRLSSLTLAHGVPVTLTQWALLAGAGDDPVTLARLKFPAVELGEHDGVECVGDVSV